jgi:hypothetical protein
MLRRPRAPGTGAFLQERLARLLAEGNPWVVGHYRRLADLQGAAKDAEADRIEDEQLQMVRVARAARELQRLQPDEVRSWTSAPPFPARTTYIPMIGGPGCWSCIQNGIGTTTTAGCPASPGSTAAPPATGPPNPAVPPEQQGWMELEEGDFLLPWLLHITMYELCERPCCAPFREPKADS